jgi:hypothetical protein
MKSLAVTLTVVLGLSLCGTAVARPMDPTTVGQPALTQQDIAGLESLVPAAEAPRDSVPSSGGLGTFAIVLISVGGALALGGVVYTTTRVVHHHAHPA